MDFFESLFTPDIGWAVFGGVLIGASASLLLVSVGKIAGISGTLFGALKINPNNLWRWVFLFGMIAGGFIAHQLFGISVPEFDTDNSWLIAVGGLLVGAGTTIANGCTSGHGICGLSRRSPRSLAATLTFMSAGIIAYYVFNHLLRGFV